MCVFMTVLGKCCKGKELLYRSMKVEQRANAACVWSKKIQDTGIKCDNVSWSVFADILQLRDMGVALYIPSIPN